MLCDDLNLPAGQAAGSGRRVGGRPEGTGGHNSPPGDGGVPAAADRDRRRAGRLGVGRLRVEQVHRTRFPLMEQAVAPAAEAVGGLGPRRHRSLHEPV